MPVLKVLLTRHSTRAAAGNNFCAASPSTILRDEASSTKRKQARLVYLPVGYSIRLFSSSTMVPITIKLNYDGTTLE